MPPIIRLLTVGNSFADNAATFLPQICAAGGQVLALVRANLPGCSLEEHWRHITCHEADPTSPAGMPFAHPVSGAPVGLRELLALEAWDFVTIQQFSWISAEVATYRPYARDLYDFIATHAPQAEILLHQTWPYRSDDPRYAEGEQTADTMYAGLTAAYRAIAEELGVRLIPVGDAFQAAGHSAEFGFLPDTAFDPANATFPHLPVQTHSLHVGWYWQRHWNTGEYTLQYDGHHAGRIGEYLGGLIFFECLTGQSVLGNAFVPPGMSAADARLLQHFAHDAVAEIRALQGR